MQIIKPQQCSIHHSWERDESTMLIVTATAAGVQLQHLDARYTSAEVAVVQLTTAEARDVAERILLALNRKTPTNPSGSAEAPQLVVTRTNDGEPYREGVCLALSAGDWNRDFSFSMEDSTAMALATALQR
ncbi:hypothetical protein [Pseudomonas sp.]|uniref:hypothetical protein n=1 Tax=Pseudomonas sp. TaxID=306 RepID=UPI0029154220|nr:hypothetical protein [Pseudomonas sp.]MDU4254502.1 hypothetical protein [Pseudomonas sp.]